MSQVITPAFVRSCVEVAFPGLEVQQKRVSGITRTELWVEDSQGAQTIFHYTTDKTSRARADQRPVEFAVLSTKLSLFETTYSQVWGGVDTPPVPEQEDFIRALAKVASAGTGN